MIALSNLADGQTINVIGNFFRLKLVFNAGGALGTELGSSTFYLITSLLILLFVLYFIYNYRGVRAVSLPMAAIAGGAVGNIIDRVRLGKVIDFLDFDFFDMNFLGREIDRWWIFNIADAAITIAIIFLLIYILFFGKRQEQKSIEKIADESAKKT
jgi:signal peptidase II